MAQSSPSRFRPSVASSDFLQLTGVALVVLPVVVGVCRLFTDWLFSGART